MVTYCKNQAQADAEVAEWLATIPGISKPNDWGNQCTALVQAVVTTLTGRSFADSLGYGNAIDHIDNASPEYFVKVWNDPQNPNLLPRVGDIAVYKGAAPLWDGRYYGHTGVVAAFNAANQTLMQQDGAAPPLVKHADGYYYSAKPAHTGTFAYVGDPFVGDVRGWLRLKFSRVVYTGADKRGYGVVQQVTNPGTTTGPAQGAAIVANKWLPGAVRQEQAHAVTLDKSLPRRATMHITSDVDPGKVQPTIEGVGAYLVREAYCPHVIWDPFTGRMIQYYPATVGSRALRAWNEDGEKHVQVEILFSRGALRQGRQYWELADTPLVGFEKLIQWLDSLGIPRQWPMGTPPPLGTPGTRSLSVWNSGSGYYGHSQVPDNDHTDPGKFPALDKVPYAANATVGNANDVLEELVSMTPKQLDDALNGWAARNRGKAGTLPWAVFNNRDRGINMEKTLADVLGRVKGMAASVLTSPVKRKGIGAGETVRLADVVAYDKDNNVQDRRGTEQVLVAQKATTAAMQELTAAVQALVNAQQGNTTTTEGK